VVGARDQDELEIAVRPDERVDERERVRRMDIVVDLTVEQEQRALAPMCLLAGA
jgi:hypothetical protein